MITSGIYAITNMENGKIYIGSTVDFDGRWREHKRTLCNSTHFNPYLQHAWNKCGEDVFEFGVLEYLGNLEELALAEQFWIDIYREEGTELYNIATPGKACMLGRKHSEESRRKMSRSRKGKSSGMLGKKHSEESKCRMSKAHKGKKHSEETRQKMRGKEHSEETKNKIREFRRGKKHSKKTQRKISKNLTGRKRGPASEETRCRMSVSQKGRKHSKETKQKIGEANSKCYPSFINEITGEIIPAGVNLVALCRKRKFGNDLYDVKYGKRRSYKGWVLA